MTARLKLSFLAMALLAASVTMAARPVKNIQSTKDGNKISFTIKKEMVGASVKVFSANGDLVAAQQLKKRRMIIDFKKVKPGTYIVIVLKNEVIEEFQYTKK